MSFIWCRHLWRLVVLSCLLSLALIACGGTNQASIGGVATNTIAASATTGPTATPTSIPTITADHHITINDDFCKTILTFSEASQITNTQIMYETAIAPTLNGSFLGACDYGVASNSVDVFIAFLPGSDDAALDAEKEFINQQDSTPGTVTPVAGLGGGAYAIVKPVQGSGKEYHLVVLDGSFIVHILDATAIADDATGINHLKDIAQIAMSRF